MDRHGSCTAEKATGVEKWCLSAKKPLQFLAQVSLFSFLVSYFSGFSSYNLHFSTLIFSLFAHAMDRKYMFLICNGILAFLVKISSSSERFIKSGEDGVKQISELPAILLGENVASVEYDIGPVAAEEEEMEQQFGLSSHPSYRETIPFLSSESILRILLCSSLQQMHRALLY